MMSGLWEHTPTAATSIGPLSSTVANVTPELKTWEIKGCNVWCYTLWYVLNWRFSSWLHPLSSWLHPLSSWVKRRISLPSRTTLNEYIHFPFVILSETKDLVAQCVRFFASLSMTSRWEDGTGEPIRLFVSDELIVHYVGTNDNSLRPYDSAGRIKILRIVTILMC